MGIQNTLLFLILAGAFSVNVRAQSPDFQSTFHVFPQFVDGALSEDRSYVSTFQISATSFSNLTRCTLSLISLPPTSLTDASGVIRTGTVFNLILGPNGWQILQSQGTQALRSGSAILQCDFPVTAHVLYTFNRAGMIVSQTTMSAAPPGRMVQILADQRKDSRVGLAIMNAFTWTGAYRISAVDIYGQLLSSVVIQLAPGQTYTRFVDEFARLPRDYRGTILIETLTGREVYASGLKFNQDSFTSIPAMVRLP